MLAEGAVVQHWVGQRPRPWNRPAPIIECLEGYPGIIVATGHYRNGVLLAPATAQRVREMVGEE
jgi:glycine/D-amino acid oxidase-like deaminating enzyme